MSRKMGPLLSTHPLVRNNEELCAACKDMFQEGDYVGLVNVGPGKDEEERKKRDTGQAYNTVAVVVHWECSPYV